MRPLILLLCSLFVTSCDDEPTSIGSSFFVEGNLDVIYIDTLTLNVSTVRYDSFITSDATRFLIGHHKDSEVGGVTASSIFQIAPDGALTVSEDFATYSRTTLTLVPDGYSFYDTSSRQTIKVHELAQEMELNEGYLFNASEFKYHPDPIGALTFLPKPNASDTLEIPLADSFGQQIFSMAQQGAEEVSTATAFVEKFQGLAVVPDTSKSGAVLGYSLNAEVRIYYWDKTVTPSEERYLSVKGGNHLRYNQIRDIRSGTPFAAIASKKESLSSLLTNESGFIQEGAGLVLRVEIPYLKMVLLDNADLTITNAILEFYPSRNDERNSSLPEVLFGSVVNYRNDFPESGSLSFQAQLIKDEYLDRDTRYQVDVRNFIMQQLATEDENRNAILFATDEEGYRQSVGLWRIGDQRSEKKMRLKLYCVVTTN